MRLAASHMVGDGGAFDLRDSLRTIVGLWALCASRAVAAHRSWVCCG
jgi:hypothetical protein